MGNPGDFGPRDPEGAGCSGNTGPCIPLMLTEPLEKVRTPLGKPNWGENRKSETTTMLETLINERFQQAQGGRGRGSQEQLEEEEPRDRILPGGPPSPLSRNQRNP